MALMGIGSSGVLLAHYLLRRSAQYQIDFDDRLSDLQVIKFSSARTFSISLTERGMSVLGRQIARIEAAARAINFQSDAIR